MRRPLAALLLTAATACLTLVPGGGRTTLVHADDDGLDVTSNVVYTVDPAKSVVHVVADSTLTNMLPDTTRGGIVTTYYFDAFSWPMPAGARNIVARTDDDELDITTVDVPDADNYFFVDIALADRLEYRRSTRVVLEYDLIGLPPRSGGLNRINPAYVGFDAYGTGDPGMMDVRFVLPEGWEAEIVGGDYTSSTSNGRVVYEMTSFEDEQYGYILYVSARRDDALASTSVTTSNGRDVEILSWPGDDEWTSFIGDQVETGLPILSDLIGQPWPEGDDFVIREAYTPYLYGYAGWYSADDSEIEIGEDLDAEAALHELSHAWFNERWFTDRWVNEGFAQAYSNRTLEARGDEWSAPTDVSPDDPAAVTLQQWGDPDFVGGADESEAYGYAAAYLVIDRIITRLDDATMRTIFAAVADRTTPYIGDLPAETAAEAVDWRRFLDLLEEVGGSTNAADLFTQYVLTPEQAADLGLRATTRERYHELDDRGGDWAPPVVVRTAMGDWAWATAGATISQAGTVLDLRDELDIKARALGIPYPDDLEAAYEAADADRSEAPTGLGTVAAAVQAQVDGADALIDAIAAEARPDGLLGWIGLVGSDLTGDLARARTAFSEGDIDTVRSISADVTDAVDGAPAAGNVRLLVTLGVLILVVGVAASARRRHHARTRLRADAVMNPSAGASWTPGALQPPGAPHPTVSPQPPAPVTPAPSDQAAASSSTGRDVGVAEPPAGSPTSDDGTS